MGRNNEKRKGEDKKRKKKGAQEGRLPITRIDGMMGLIPRLHDRAMAISMLIRRAGGL